MLADTLVDHAADTIIYSDGTYSVTIKAWIAKTPYQVMDGEVMIPFEAHDFGVRTADLILNSVTIRPAGGHTITHGGLTYEVGLPKPFRGNEPHANVYDCIGPNDEALLIHTKGIT